MEKQNAVGALAALAQETRLDVFRALVVAGAGGLTPGALSESLAISPATLSFHLKELKNARLAHTERRGRSLVYRADFATMQAVVAYLLENCCRAQGCDGGATPC